MAFLRYPDDKTQKDPNRIEAAWDYFSYAPAK